MHYLLTKDISNEYIVDGERQALLPIAMRLGRSHSQEAPSNPLEALDLRIQAVEQVEKFLERLEVGSFPFNDIGFN